MPTLFQSANDRIYQHGARDGLFEGGVASEFVSSVFERTVAPCRDENYHVSGEDRRKLRSTWGIAVAYFQDDAFNPFPGRPSWHGASSSSWTSI
jgi:hypothetical protein